MQKKTMNMGKGQRVRRICLTAGLIALILVGGFLGFYKWRQSKIVLDTPLGYTFACEEGTEVKAAALNCIESLIEQHQQPYISIADKIGSYEIESVEVLEDGGRKVARIDFVLVLSNPKSDEFADWGLVYDENAISGQWVVTFSVSEAKEQGMTEYTVENLQRPAAYDLEKYNASGQAEVDELEHELNEQVPYDKTQCTYKIENEICSVSYDGGDTWIQTPLPLEQLEYYVDGNFKTNELCEGSYIISPQKTVILYGGFFTPLTCLFSNDMGNTWNTSKPNEGLRSCHIKFCSFPTNDIGYIIIGSEKTMSWEAESVYKTVDGGATWTRTGEGAKQILMVSACFITEDIGFISYPYMDGAEYMLYRTEDSAASWNPVTLDIEVDLQPFFTRPQTPIWQDGELILLVDEGEGSDYGGLNPMQLKYVSQDMGVTWEFVETIELN